MKALVANNCSGCHTPSFTLQHRFDEAGWTAIVDLMKRVNVSGVYGGPDHKPAGVLDRHQQELAAYLARARGPSENHDDQVASRAHRGRLRGWCSRNTMYRSRRS